MRKFDYVQGADRTIPLPKRGTAKSAGYDFFAPCDIVVPAKRVMIAIFEDGRKETMLTEGHSELVFFNVKAYMPDDEYLALHIRSSMAIKKGLQVAQGTAIIDADYADNPDNEGNIGAMFYNHGECDVVIKKGERIMQGIFCKYGVTDDDDTDGVRVSGYGSTGK